MTGSLFHALKKSPHKYDNRTVVSSVVFRGAHFKAPEDPRFPAWSDPGEAGVPTEKTEEA